MILCKRHFPAWQLQEPFPLLHFTQQKCFPLLEIPFSTLFPLLVFVQMTGISLSLCGASPKAPPYGCHQKGTVPEVVSLLSLLLCSLFLPLTLHCAGRAPLHQPQHRQPLLLPSSSPTGGPHSSMGTQGKCHFLLGSAQPRHPRPQTDSTGAWDFQSILQKQLVANRNRILEVSELLQGRAWWEEVPENTGDVGTASLKPLWLEVLFGAGAAQAPAGLFLWDHPTSSTNSTPVLPSPNLSRNVLMILASDLAGAVRELTAFLGQFPNLKPQRSAFRGDPHEPRHQNHHKTPGMAHLGHHQPPAARTRQGYWFPLWRGIFCPREEVVDASSEAHCACWY